MAKKKRTPKRSQGVHGGGGKVRGLSDVAKVLLGKGMLDNTPVLQRKDD